MRKQHKIKWREADLQELTRVVNNFNAKLRRIEKKNPENAKYLPKFSKTVYDEDIGEDVIVFTDRLSVNQMKDLIQTRQDFNREINALKRFSRRGAEELTQIKTGIDNKGNTVKLDYNVYTTKWQKTEMTRRLNKINKLREERLKLIKETPVAGTKYKHGDLGMGSQTEHDFSPFKIATKSTVQSDMKWKLRSILKESQTNYFTESDEALRDNYIWSLQANYYTDDIGDVIDKIQNMDIKDFLKIFYANPGVFEFSYHDEEQYHHYTDKVYEIWHQTEGGPYKVNVDGETKVILDSFTDAKKVVEDYKQQGNKKVTMIDDKGKKIKL